MDGLRNDAHSRRCSEKGLCSTSDLRTTPEFESISAFWIPLAKTLRFIFSNNFTKSDIELVSAQNAALSFCMRLIASGDSTQQIS